MTINIGLLPVMEIVARCGSIELAIPNITQSLGIVEDDARELALLAYDKIIGCAPHVLQEDFHACANYYVLRTILDGAIGCKNHALALSVQQEMNGMIER